VRAPTRRSRQAGTCNTHWVNSAHDRCDGGAQAHTEREPGADVGRKSNWLVREKKKQEQLSRSDNPEEAFVVGPLSPKSQREANNVRGR
jgi:hypothetical protein